MTELTPDQLNQLKWVDKKLTELKREFIARENTDPILEPEAMERIKEDYEVASSLSREILTRYGMTPESDGLDELDEVEESGYSYAFSSGYQFRRAEEDRKRNTDFDPQYDIDGWYATAEEAEAAQAVWGGRTPTFIICRSDETGDVFPLDPEKTWI